MTQQVDELLELGTGASPPRGEIGEDRVCVLIVTVKGVGDVGAVVREECLRETRQWVQDGRRGRPRLTSDPLCTWAAFLRLGWCLDLGRR